METFKEKWVRLVIEGFEKPILKIQHPLLVKICKLIKEKNEHIRD
jgi:hypothetical protein